MSLEKVDIVAQGSWDYALAILAHELRKNPPAGPRRRLLLEFSKGVSHEDFWVDGEHSSQNVPVFCIYEVDN